MKVIHLFGFLIIGSKSLLAQSIKPGLLQKSILGTHDLLPVNQTKAISTGEYTWGKIYALPQDNMPCLVPDINAIAIIPTIKYFSSFDNLPNPYKKNEIIQSLNNNAIELNYFPKKRQGLFYNYQLPKSY